MILWKGRESEEWFKVKFKEDYDQSFFAYCEKEFGTGERKKGIGEVRRKNCFRRDRQQMPHPLINREVM